MRYSLFLLFVMASCSEHKTVSDNLLFVQGMEMEPNSPRRAIKLTPDSIYYCEEKVYGERSGNYDYYGRRFDRDSFYAFKGKADKLFANVGFTENHIADATAYSIVLKEQGKYMFRKEFVYEYLDESQQKFVLKLETLFDGKFKHLTSNPGMDDGLLNMLPEPPLPPPFPSGSDYDVQ